MATAKIEDLLTTSRKAISMSINTDREAVLWYPVMLAQERGEISEAKGAELLSMSIQEYRNNKESAIQDVLRMVNALPVTQTSLVTAVAANPDLLEPRVTEEASEEEG